MKTIVVLQAPPDAHIVFGVYVGPTRPKNYRTTVQHIIRTVARCRRDVDHRTIYGDSRVRFWQVLEFEDGCLRKIRLLLSNLGCTLAGHRQLERIRENDYRTCSHELFESI